MFAKGTRVRFKQDDKDKARRERNNPADPPLTPGPDEVFVVQEVVPWTDQNGKEHFDDKAWVDLGPGHRMVAMSILESA